MERQNRKFNLRPDTYDKRDHKFADNAKIYPLANIPMSIDLRPNCPSTVFDQGAEGSCTANAGCSAVSMLFDEPETVLSRRFLYNMERIIDNTFDYDSGAEMRTICKALLQYGVCEEKDMPYVPETLFVEPSDEIKKKAEKYKIDSYQRLDSLDEIKRALAVRNQPVLMGMKIFVNALFDEFFVDGMLPIPPKDDYEIGYHAVLVVGYVDKKKLNFFTRLKNMILRLFGKKVPEVPGYLIVRNSWGPDWQLGGYFLMPYEFIELGHTFDYWIIER